jgi:hypothetical protein
LPANSLPSFCIRTLSTPRKIYGHSGTAIAAQGTSCWKTFKPPAMAAGTSPAKGKFSLYADLLDPSSSSSPGTISGAPVTYKKPADASTVDQDEAAKKQQALAGT